MDQQIIRHARLGMLMFREQAMLDATPDAARVHKALTKLAAFGQAIENEGLSESEAADLLRSTFFGATVKS